KSCRRATRPVAVPKRACGKSAGKCRCYAQRTLGKKGEVRAPPYGQERFRESSLQELSQFRRRLELWNRVEFLERRRKRVGETPNRAQLKFLVLRREVEIMHSPGQVFGRFELTFHESFVDDHLGGDIGEFTPLPGLH